MPPDLRGASRPASASYSLSLTVRFLVVALPTASVALTVTFAVTAAPALSAADAAFRAFFGTRSFNTPLLLAASAFVAFPSLKVLDFLTSERGWRFDPTTSLPVPTAVHASLHVTPTSIFGASFWVLLPDSLVTGAVPSIVTCRCTRAAEVPLHEAVWPV